MDAPDAEPMETDQPQLSLSLLEVIRSAQEQHGLKHKEYARYRTYCSQRLRSLYKALKFTHGKKTYQKRKLELKHITDARHLHIPLMSAERAWAYAMEIKHDPRNKADLQKRRHLLKRLTKASKWAAELAHFSSEKCDTRSALEAEAYSLWMQGNVLFEDESDWQTALANFLKAKALFQELAKVGELEQQQHCLLMVEEIEPSIRYCKYQIDRQGGKVPDPSEILALDGQQGRGMDLLQAKLAALTEAAQTQQAAATSHLQWQGRKVPVRNERVRVCLHQASELAAQLETAAGDGSTDAFDARLVLFDRMINCYNEARGFVRNALKAEQGSGGEAVEELQTLETSVSGVILERTIERNLAAVQHSEQRFLGALERLAQGKKLKDKQDKFAKPEDVVRLYDTLIRNYEDLSELAGRLGRQGEEIIEAASVKISEHRASRCFYIAHANLAADKFPEAHALFLRAAERAAAAASLQEDTPRPDPSALQALETLRQRASAYALVARADASAAAEAEKAAVVGGVDSMGLSDEQKEQQRESFLLDNLEAWEAFAGGEAGPRVFRYPPVAEAVAVRPTMFNTAVDFVQYPGLEHRRKVEKKSMYSRLFGWGAK